MVRFIEFDRERDHHVIMDPEDDTKFTRMLMHMEEAGRNCYKSQDGPITPETASRFVKKIMRFGHFSILEHGKMTVKFVDVSRGFTHSIVRNRLCTFSQQSTVHALENDTEMRFVVPPNVGLDEVLCFEHRCGTAHATYRWAAEFYEAFYREARNSGSETVQARYFLPIGVCNDIVVTANMRQWRHIFIMRTKRGEDWENLKVIGALMCEAKMRCPVLFDDFIENGEDDYGLPYYQESYGA